VSRTRRAASLVAILTVAAVAALVDRRVERPPLDVAAEVRVPAQARAEAGSSAWYCVGANADEGGLARGTVVVANAGDGEVTATVTAISDSQAPTTATLAVPARGRAELALADLVTASHVSAVVELDRGSAVVEMAAEGSLGETVTPCASAASSEWYFADGVTARDAREVLTLLNPFPDDALVDLRFATEDGTVTPEALTGVTVRGRSLLALEIGEFVPRRESVAASVSTRTGRLVVGRRQSFDGSIDRRGMALSLGATSVAEGWYLPEGLALDGLEERFQIFNPGREEARVELDVVLDEGEAEPILLSVPPESQVSVVANNEARIPPGIGHALHLTATNGVGVVVERRIVGAGGVGRQGLAITAGAVVATERWVAAAGSIDPDHDHAVAVQNPGTRAATVSFTALVGRAALVPGLEAVEVPPGARRVVRLGDHGVAGPTAVLVEADEPVVVERDVFRRQELGLAMAMAVPLEASGG